MRKGVGMFTVVEISSLFGVSNKTIYRYLKKYDSQMRKHFLRDNQGNKALNREGLEKLAKLINKKIELPDKDEKNLILEELRKQIDELKEDKTYLREQNQELKQNISNLTKLLDQEQQIRLYNIKKLEEPTAEKVEVENFEKLNNENFLQKIIDLISFKSK